MAEKFDGLIDEPKPSATLETWEAYLEKLRKIDPAPEFKQIKVALMREANQVISEKRSEKKKSATAK
jgi:hypothetical protein